MTNEILKKVNDYYSDKIKSHGATSRGVDWNGIESHYLRFDQLTKILPKERKTVLDFGCGFGSLVDYIKEQGIECQYFGFDISKEMINVANGKYKGENIEFSTNLEDNKRYDYTIANGVFNVKLEVNDEEWGEYIIKTLEHINKISIKGFSFNILTSYSDEEFKKSDLHYANPMFYFDYCKRNFSKNVGLLHDYDLYEFTIHVKK